MATPATKKNNKVNVRLNDLLYKAFRDGAEARGMTSSEYLRYLVSKTTEGGLG
jgi:predicted DNA binding CopG/RHH family protein